MDLSKTFDCLPRELTLTKLYIYGVHKKSFELLQDYLSNRFQRAALDSTFSSWLEILLGAPQRSILGPLLFNTYLNDYHGLMKRLIFVTLQMTTPYLDVHKLSTKKL